MTENNSLSMGTTGIIGGTRGLGYQLALRAQRAGHDTVVYGRSVAESADLAPGIEQRHLDLCDRSSVAHCDVRLSGPLRIFWVAGAFLMKDLTEVTDQEIDGLTELLLTGPLVFLRRVLQTTDAPVHLVTIASSSGWRQRTSQSLYCGLKAAQAHGSRNLVPELVAAHPESKVTVVNPGGLAIPDFHSGLELEYGKMMDPAEVADIIWRAADTQQNSFLEMQILRSLEPGEEGTPQVSYGVRAPETPNNL